MYLVASSTDVPTTWYKYLYRVPVPAIFVCPLSKNQHRQSSRSSHASSDPKISLGNNPLEPALMVQSDAKTNHSTSSPPEWVPSGVRLETDESRRGFRRIFVICTLAAQNEGIDASASTIPGTIVQKKPNYILVYPYRPLVQKNRRHF
jgi:hypothetical protein